MSVPASQPSAPPGLGASPSPASSTPSAPSPAPASGTSSGNLALPSGGGAGASAKAIPAARPRPIAGAMASSPAGRSPSSYSLSASFRRGGRSVAENGTPDDSNWRARGMSVDKTDSAGFMTVGSKGRAGPERTVGGFEKREVRESPGSGASALSTSKGKSATSALSHVPCRFYKAGACTAGSSCPFSHDLGGKKEVCQWFLKGDCKFGHKCALAHVRPGEPMSMDRRNKKEQQREARERADGGDPKAPKAEGDDKLGSSPVNAKAVPTPISHPVPIKSAIAGSLGSSVHSPRGVNSASSPLREPYGPPPGVSAGSPSAGFNHARPISGSAGFASSPSRPSPLSTSYTSRPPVPSSLKASSIVSTSSPLRPPSSGAAFSSSFSHATTLAPKGSGQLSASFADNALHRSIWTRSETPDEPLSPPSSRRPILPSGASARVIPDVFDEHDDHGEDLLPSSLSDLLTPSERARRMSRHDSHDSHAGSPSRLPYNPHQYVGAERLAQSAGAALPPGGFLQSLWSQDGRDARKEGDGAEGTSPAAAGAELSFGGAQPQPPLRQSLLSQQRQPDSASPSPKSSPSKALPAAAPAVPGARLGAWQTVAPAVDAPFLMRGTDPSSPSARVLSEHAPGQSLPGGLAAALSRMHMQPGAQARTPSGLGAHTPGSAAAATPKRDDHEDEGLFHMDG